MPMPPEFEELARKVNNWGRWGVDDEIGTLNLITAEVVTRAAACVRMRTSIGPHRPARLLRAPLLLRRLLLRRLPQARLQ